MTAVFGFAGLSLKTDCVALDPRLPAEWRSLAFRIQWRGRTLRIRIRQAEDVVEATLEAGETIALSVSGRRHDLRLGDAVDFAVERAAAPEIVASRG